MRKRGRKGIQPVGRLTIILVALLLLSAVMSISSAEASVTIAPETRELSDSASWWYRAMAVDGDTVHVCYSDGTQMYYANGSGGTLSPRPLSAGQAGVDVSLVAAGGEVHISYTDAEGGGLYYGTTISGSWSYGTVDGVRGGDSRIAVDGGGDVHIAYIGDGLRYAHGTAGSWEVTTLDENGASVHAMVLDSRGHAYILYSDGTNYRYASNADGPWELQTVIDRSLILGGSMVLDRHDHVHFGLVNADHELLYANESTGIWNAQTVATSVRADSAYIAVDDDGHVHLTYTDQKRSSLRYATNADGSWWRGTIDDDGPVHGGPIAVAPDGRVHVLYMKGAVGELAVWYATFEAHVNTAPEAPRELTATPQDGGVRLQWIAPASDGGSAITGYRLYWSEGSGEFNTILVTGTEHEHDSAVNGRSYHYMVAAMNAEGEGPTTEVVTVTLDGTSPYPSAPRNVSVGTEKGRAVLTWMTPEYGENITSYRIYRGATPSVELLTSTDGTSFEDSNVASGATYYYRISALNGSTEGDLSVTVNVTMPSSLLDDVGSFLVTAPGIVTAAVVAAVGTGLGVHAVRRRSKQ